MMIDDLMFAGQCCVVALAICTDGTKFRSPVAGRHRNKTVVTNLLADLVSRNLDASDGLGRSVPYQHRPEQSTRHCDGLDGTEPTTAALMQH